MRTVGIFEAKNRLSELVSEAERGERILLTRHGRPVAELSPARTGDPEAKVAMKWIRARRWSLGGLSIKELVNEGRRR